MAVPYTWVNRIDEGVGGYENLLDMGEGALGTGGKAL